MSQASAATTTGQTNEKKRKVIAKLEPKILQFILKGKGSNIPMGQNMTWIKPKYNQKINFILVFGVRTGNETKN